ncbi:uncharacterized protein LOC125480921 isoform X4 [Pyrus x bretschneideri]|uniref:uncharacterized protein LOC125480921 isoform X4 n=1 Tax=Pyrus x bretschneideri TaxID=225117 RepID=UPI00202FA1BF|nr:uncharacterized protein LOC125480921 isoform X4 [Pyrus x bretschneideri]
MIWKSDLVHCINCHNTKTHTQVLCCRFRAGSTSGNDPVGFSRLPCCCFQSASVSGLKDILHEMMQFGAFRAKLSWNVVYANGARGMDVQN